MKIVADEQIPLLDELFAGEKLLKKAGEAIERQDLLDADMLWVRTVTRVDAKLLEGTAVRFVGTATAGHDHLDTGWLESQGIAWAYAPGANATAVAEYVLCVIAALRLRGGRAGVIGAGRVGETVANYLRQIGFDVTCNDPPRAGRDPGFQSTPLAEFAHMDLICVHAALTKHGAHPSYHLLGRDFFQRQNPGTVILNAARGEVVDTAVLLSQPHLRLCLDVWENEPSIDLALLRRTTIATPHIAAYSKEAKRRASLLLYQQAQKFFALPDKQIDTHSTLKIDVNKTDWQARALAVFDPLVYTGKMHEFLLNGPGETAKRFSQLRKHYPWRESFL